MAGCKLISRGKKIVVPALSGHERLSNPPKIFFTGFPRGYSWARCSSMPPTPETPAAVFELRENRTIKAACCDKPETRCFSSFLQVTAFCEANPHWLRGEFATLFPFRAGSDILFADAYVRPDDSVVIHTEPIDFRYLWAGCHNPWIVVPKLWKISRH